MPTILVADDDKHFLTVLERLLAAAGHEVHLARNGTEALALAERRTFDLAVLDVAMPFMAGDELLLRLPAALPLLFVSGRDLDRLDGVERAGLRHLRKPVDLDELLAEVEALLPA